MKHNIISALFVVISGCLLPSCSNDDSSLPSLPTSGKIPMEFSFSHPSLTRVTDTAFEEGDKVGLFLTEEASPLEIAGNNVNNEPLTLNGNSWKSRNPLFWDTGKYNAFAYFPHRQTVSSITDLPFSVALDQSSGKNADGLSSYEASDFLFASSKGIEASAGPVNLQFRHIMSKLTIRLVKGEDFEGDLPEKATVLLHNTVTSATIDLSAGIATRESKGEKRTITARQDSPTMFSVITVPQRLDNRVPLIEVMMNGVSFLFESKFLFKPGTNHLVNLVIDKNPEQVKIEIGGEITDWN